MKRYPHYKHYKPRISQAQIDAHHKFMMLMKEEPVMKTQLEITDTEKDLLKRLIAAKLEIKNDEIAHANSHATELHDPDHPVLLRMWEELNV